MSTYVRVVLCLVLFATVTGQIASQDAAICEALRAIDATHGDQFRSYLSDKGLGCLEPAITPTPTAIPDCFASDSAYLAGSMNIRAEASAASEKLGVALAGTYAVKGSEQRDDYCWIEIADGWIAQTARVTPATMLESQTTARAISQPDGSQDQTQAKEPSPTAVPEPVELWSKSGNQDSKSSVTLDFTPGLYKLNVIRGWPSGHGGFARLTNIISQPTACMMHRDHDVTFPATLRMEQNCKVYATLETDLSSTYRERTRSWSLSITRESDALPPIPAADGWSEQGRGPAQRPLELSFEPGIYRISGTGEMGVKNIFLHEWSPDRCTAEDYVDVPDQIRVYSVCTVKGSLWFWDHLWDRTGKWSYSIEKLE